MKEYILQAMSNLEAWSHNPIGPLERETFEVGTPLITATGMLRHKETEEVTFCNMEEYFSKIANDDLTFAKTHLFTVGFGVGEILSATEDKLVCSNLFFGEGEVKRDEDITFILKPHYSKGIYHYLIETENGQAHNTLECSLNLIMTDPRLCKRLFPVLMMTFACIIKDDDVINDIHQCFIRIIENIATYLERTVH